VPEDFLLLGIGKSLDAKRATTLLSIKKNCISKIFTGTPASVRYDESMPLEARERMEEIAGIMRMITQA